MPFDSKAQQRFLYATNKEVAEKFASEMKPKDYKKLPEKKEDKSKDKKKDKKGSKKW